MSTVGYGDVFCETVLGRTFLVFFLLVGLVSWFMLIFPHFSSSSMKRLYMNAFCLPLSTSPFNGRWKYLFVIKTIPFYEMIRFVTSEKIYSFLATVNWCEPNQLSMLFLIAYNGKEQIWVQNKVIFEIPKEMNWIISKNRLEIICILFQTYIRYWWNI